MAVLWVLGAASLRRVRIGVADQKFGQWEPATVGHEDKKSLLEAVQGREGFELKLCFFLRILTVKYR